MIRNLLFIIALLICFVDTSSAGVSYGAILIRDKTGDSLAINADGSLNVTSTPSGDTAVVQLNGDTIPVNVTTDTLNVRSRVLNDSIDVSANIKNDTLNTRSRILNDSINVSANIKNDSLNVRANIKNDTLNTRSRILNDSINVSANIKNDSLNVRANITTDSINVSANIKNDSLNVRANITTDSINVRANITTDSINVSANIKNDTLNVRSRTLNDSVKIYDNNGYTAQIDGVTEGIIVIEPDHHEIHEGNHYFLCGFAAVDSGDSVLFSVSVPDTSRIAHMTFSIEGTSRTEIYIIEGATITGGTAITAKNNDRNSGNTSMLTLKSGAAVTSPGDTLFTQSRGLEGATPSAASSGGIVARNKELLLKNNAVTLFNIVSRDDGNIVSYCGDWYEHIPEN